MSPYDYKRQMREKLKPLAHGMTLNLHKQLLITRVATKCIFVSLCMIIKYIFCEHRFRKNLNDLELNVSEMSLKTKNLVLVRLT